MNESLSILHYVGLLIVVANILVFVTGLIRACNRPAHYDQGDIWPPFNDGGSPFYQHPLTFLPITDTIVQIMKKGIHPTTYRPVVFQDEQAKFAFLTQSTTQTNDTIKWEDGNTYPLIKMHISSASHPFFTGEEKIIDTEGRVDRFKARFEAAEKRKEALASKAKKAQVRSEKKAEDK